MILKRLIIALLALVPFAAFSQTTITIGENSADNFAGMQDALIASAAPDDNDDTGTVSLREVEGGQIRHGLLRWTGISNIPSGATITGATITLTQSFALFGETWTLNEVTRAWVENTATYNRYDGTNTWTTPGVISVSGGIGTCGSGDCNSTTSGAASTDTVGTTYTVSLNATGLAAIQAWVDGTRTNNGWVIWSNDVGSQPFISSEGADGSRPKISITYTVGGGGTGLRKILQQQEH